MRRVVLAGGLLVVSAWLLAGGVYRNVRYCAVTDRRTPGRGPRTPGPTATASPLGAPDHVVRDVRLYLKVQTAWYIPVADLVRFTSWDAKGVEEFRRRHPELEGCWPSPERPGGGVPWIGKGPRCSRLIRRSRRRRLRQLRVLRQVGSHFSCGPSPSTWSPTTRSRQPAARRTAMASATGAPRRPVPPGACVRRAIASTNA